MLIMDKLADISVFESLQLSANSAMGFDSIHAVFDDVFLRNKLAGKSVPFDVLPDNKKAYLFNIIISPTEQQSFFRHLYFLYEHQIGWQAELKELKKWIAAEPEIKNNNNVKYALSEAESGLRLTIQEADKFEQYVPRLFTSRLKERWEKIKELGLTSADLNKFTTFSMKRINAILTTAKKKGKTSDGSLPPIDDMKKSILSGSWSSMDLFNTVF
ncbi:MAG: hypothetical protein LBP59_11275 [Planctomycetaceae bacterium]|jgi:hypothetical protein|nr:hypothetical protein [Planctomycetaceae bacterium]